MSVYVPSWVIGGELRPPVSLIFKNPKYNTYFEFHYIFCVNIVVSPAGDGTLEFEPPLNHFDTMIPELILDMAQTTLTLPALDVATIDSKFHEDPLSPVFPEEISPDGYQIIYSPMHQNMLIAFIM